MIFTGAVNSASDIAGVRTVFEAYLRFIHQTLNNDLEFQGTDKEFTTFPDIYDALFAAKIGDKVVGACALKPFPEAGKCELKRLYVKPEGRGRNFGHTLTGLCIKAAIEAGYDTMYLDTNPSLTHANTIYEAYGFKDIPAYYDNPMPGTRYMAIELIPS